MGTQTLLIDGAVGQLELIYELPDTAPEQITVVCHPHPLHQGTMHNKVAYILSKSLLLEHSIGVRFNFRGVGKSEGEYDDGKGETQDLFAVLDWVTAKWPDLPINLSGFSFGSYVALLAVQDESVIKKYGIKKLISVALPVGRWEFDGLHAPDVIPWLLAIGNKDELVDLGVVKQWHAKLNNPPAMHVIDSADHFFHGKLNELRSVIQEWANET